MNFEIVSQTTHRDVLMDLKNAVFSPSRKIFAMGAGNNVSIFSSENLELIGRVSRADSDKDFSQPKIKNMFFTDDNNLTVYFETNYWTIDIVKFKLTEQSELSPKPNAGPTMWEITQEQSKI